ncbi:MAG TPA: AAA family ATPase [Chitinophagales bacterium]|nr:AAA family ATPase [Chitinophagales bacterium]
MAKNSPAANYKYRDLKVFGPADPLAEGKRKYQQVLEESATTYIYSELSLFNKKFDEEEWNVKVNLRAFHANGKEICDLKVERTVKTDENIVYFREGWGNPTPGSFWKKEQYYWEAWVDGVMVGSKTFYVSNSGKVTNDSNPYLSIQSVKLYEGPNNGLALAERKYLSKFSKDETRFVWAELLIQNLLPDTNWPCELFFDFYNDARQLKGQCIEFFFMNPDQSGNYTLTTGWGSDAKGTWYPGNFTLEIIFMDHLIGVVPFSVGDAAEEGAVSILNTPQYKIPVQQQSVENVETLEQVVEKLDELIGLSSIKTKIHEYLKYLEFTKLRAEKGLADGDKINLHSVFTGNPGTGKTTVARLLSRIYAKMGLLSKGHLVEVDRADLVAEYIGQTAPRTKEVINRARGGVLFIDEAYALPRKSDDSKDFGKEVIEILLKEVSDGKGDIAIIVAGYPEEMETFLDSNPGLKSRFSQVFEFPDYLPQELDAIAEFALKERNLVFSSDAKKYLYEKLVEAYRNRDRTFGNARLVNGWIDEAKLNMGLRVMRHADPKSLNKESFTTVEMDDFRKIFASRDHDLPDIPIDEFLLKDALQELNNLVGMSNIKSEINEMVKLVRFYREEGKDVLSRFSLHSVFMGNPGTGKTTVARIIARIYKALGLLERGHLVEVDKQALVAGYVGQTAIKTAHVVDTAKGGLLFIDEAYALSSGTGNDFGSEAIETLLKRMEDLRGQFVVIVAGYTDNMNRFLESNPGLKSRFDKTFLFEDYSPEELFAIAMSMLKAENLVADEDAAEHLRKFLQFLHDKRDKYFGNARNVRKIIEETVKNRDLRLAGIPKDQRTPDLLGKIILADVEEFKLAEQTSDTRKRIGFNLPGKN